MHATPFGSVKNTPEFKVPDAVHRSHQRPVKIVKNTVKAFGTASSEPRTRRPSMRSRFSLNDQSMKITETCLENGKQGRDFTAAEEAEILSHIEELPIFNQLPRNVAVSLIQNSLCVEYVPGEGLCYQGNEITDTLVILKGNVETWRKNVSVSAVADAAAPKKDAASDATGALAAAAASTPASGPGKRRMGFNLKAALQAVDSVLGRKQTQVGPGAALGRHVTWLRADAKHYYDTSATADGHVTAIGMTRRMFHDVLQATIGTELQALAYGDNAVKTEMLNVLSQPPEQRPRKTILDIARHLQETNAFLKQLRSEHVEQFLSCATLRSVPEGHVIFHQFEDIGKTPEMYLILKGSVSVHVHRNTLEAKAAGRVQSEQELQELSQTAAASKPRQLGLASPSKKQLAKGNIFDLLHEAQERKELVKFSSQTIAEEDIEASQIRTEPSEAGAGVSEAGGSGSVAAQTMSEEGGEAESGGREAIDGLTRVTFAPDVTFNSDVPPVDAMAGTFFELSKSTESKNYEALEGLTCTALLHSGDSFGEQIILGAKYRTATVVAREDCLMLALEEKDFPRFKQIFGKGVGFFHPERLKRLLYKTGSMRSLEDLEQLVNLTKSNPFFRRLEPKVRYEICKKCTAIRLADDELVVEQGELGDAFYIILSGSVSVHIQHEETMRSFKEGRKPETLMNRMSIAQYYGPAVRVLNAGDAFGETALDSTMPRNATVLTCEPTELLRLDREDYIRVLREANVDSLNAKLAFLRTLPTISRWESAAKVHLSYYMRLKRFDKGAEVTTQGQRSEGVFLIKRGSCRVLMDPPPGTSAAARGANRFATGPGATHSRMLEVALLGEREIFGELSSLDPKGVEPATVAVASDGTELYCIDQASLEAALGSDMLKMLMANAEERQAWQRQRMEELTTMMEETRLPPTPMRPKTSSSRPATESSSRPKNAAATLAAAGMTNGILPQPSRSRRGVASQPLTTTLNGSKMVGGLKKSAVKDSDTFPPPREGPFAGAHKQLGFTGERRPASPRSSTTSSVRSSIARRGARQARFSSKAARQASESPNVVRRMGIQGNVRAAQRSTASVPAIDFVKLSIATGHPEYYESSLGPLPPPPGEDPGEQAGPLADGNLLPSIIRDFRPQKENLSYRQKNNSRGSSRGRTPKTPKTPKSERSSGAGANATGFFSNPYDASAAAPPRTAGRKSRHHADNEIVSDVAIAMGRVPGGEGEDFKLHQQLLKSRRNYLAADAPGAPYSKDPLDENADPTKAKRRTRPAPVGASIIPKWDVDMRPARSDGGRSVKSKSSGTVQLMCKTTVPANASLTGAKGPGYTDRLIFYCTRDHIGRIVRKTLNPNLEE